MKYLLSQENTDKLWKAYYLYLDYLEKNSLPKLSLDVQEGIEKGWMIVSKNFFDSQDQVFQTQFKRPKIIYGMDDWTKLSDLPAGCMVDEDVYDHFLNILPPLGDSWNYLLQVSEAIDHVNGRTTYNTFIATSYTKVWRYCGACWRGKDFIPTEGLIHLYLSNPQYFTVRVSVDPSTRKIIGDFAGQHNLHIADIKEIKEDLQTYLQRRPIDDLDIIECQATMGGWRFE